MKKILCLLLLFCCVGLVIPFAGAEAAIVSVRGIAKDGKLETAMLDARKRAVYKTLSMIIREDASPDSVFQQILANFTRYAEANLKPEGKKSGPQGLMIFVKVPVDEELLAKDVKALHEAQQDMHEDVAVYCLVRATGAQDNDAATGTMARDFAIAFKRLGFVCSAGDSLPGFKEILREGEKKTQADYESQLMSNLQQSWMQVNVALLGEVHISTEAKLAMGFMKKAVIKVKAVDMTKGKVYAEFSADYLRKGPTERDAEQLVVQKAAIDAAEKLAAETLKYWQKL